MNICLNLLWTFTFTYLAHFAIYKLYNIHYTYLLQIVNLKSQTFLIEMLKLTSSTNLISLLDSYSHANNKYEILM